VAITIVGPIREPTPDATRPLNEVPLLQTLHSKEVLAFLSIEMRRRPLNSLTPNPVPKTVADTLPLAAVFPRLTEDMLAALKDSMPVMLHNCIPKVAVKLPNTEPLPTPDTTRPVRTLSLLQTLPSKAVATLELDAMEVR